MARIAVSRRKLLEAGTCALAYAAAFPGTARARAGTGRSTTAEEIVRTWYKAWEKKDLGQFEALLASNFTFTRVSILSSYAASVANGSSLVGPAGFTPTDGCTFMIRIDLPASPGLGKAYKSVRSRRASP